MNSGNKINDKDISTLLGNALRFGVYLSLSVVFIGAIIYLYRHGHEQNIFIHKKFAEHNENIADLLRDTYHGILHARGYYIIQFGILLLIATPLMRIILSMISFAVEKDTLYVGITFTVLIIIIISMLTGFGG